MNTDLATTQALALLLGLGTGVGVWLFIAGWRGAKPPARRRSRQPRIAAQRRRDLIRTAIAVTAAMVAGVATGWVVGAILAALAAWALPRVLGRDPEHVRRTARVEAIAIWTEMLRDTLSAASGLEQAILATAPLAPVPIRGEIAALAARLENGERLAPSLRLLAEEFADPTGDLVIAALVNAAEQQSRQLAELLGALAHTAREQVSMRMRVEAGRARTRTSVRVIVGTTLVFAIAVVVLNRSYVSVYDSVTGQTVLLGVGLLFTAGFVWLNRISRVAELPRLLAAAQPSSEHARPGLERRR